MKTKRKKQVGVIALVLGLCVVALAVYFGIKELRATGLSPSQQQQGQVYYDFFTLVERYTLQTHTLPASLEELKTNAADLRNQIGDWPREGDRFASVITPDFSIVPDSDNIEQFAPGYAERSFWARSHCEALWKLIATNCGHLP